MVVLLACTTIANTSHIDGDDNIVNQTIIGVGGEVNGNLELSGFADLPVRDGAVEYPAGGIRAGYFIDFTPGETVGAGLVPSLQVTVEDAYAQLDAPSGRELERREATLLGAAAGVAFAARMNRKSHWQPSFAAGLRLHLQWEKYLESADQNCELTCGLFSAFVSARISYVVNELGAGFELGLQPRHWQRPAFRYEALGTSVVRNDGGWEWTPTLALVCQL